MTDTQWLFEFETLAIHQEEHYEETKNILKAIKRMFIDIYGLNLMPVAETEEEDGRLRLMKDDEFMPLALISGREEVVQTISERMKEYSMQEETDKTMEERPEVSLEEMEDFMDDVIFPDDPEEMRKYLIWNDPSTKKLLETMVKPLEKFNEDDNTNTQNVINYPKGRKKSKVTIDNG